MLPDSLVCNTLSSMNLDDQIKRIFAPVRPKLVLLFGSRALGTDDDLSDVDLIVVYETDKRFLDRLEELYRLWDLPGGVDILADTPAEFEDMKNRSGFVIDAVKHGRIVVEAS
jgi:predicted nucleotidyltransferase